MTTVCLRCRHFQNLEPDSPRARAWYNHLCKASPLPVAVDPYDGTEKPVAVNDLGTRYFPEHRFRYCRDVNDGDCPKYAPKPDLSAQFR